MEEYLNIDVILVSRYGIRYTGYEIRDTGYEIPDPAFLKFIDRIHQPVPGSSRIAYPASPNKITLAKIVEYFANGLNCFPGNSSLLVYYFM